MVKNYSAYFTIFLLVFSSFLYGQQKKLWLPLTGAKISNSQIQGKIKLEKYKAFDLRINEMKQTLLTAPGKEVRLSDSSLKMYFPDEKGNLISFLVKEAPVMHPDLAKKYPNNRSYIGVAEKDPLKRIRFSLNQIGLYAIVAKGSDIQFIEPLGKDKKSYRVYNRASLEVEDPFNCFTRSLSQELKTGALYKDINDGKLRTYRLALAATGEYSQFHIDLQGANGGTDAQKKAVVLASMTTALTRINAVYENDLAIRLELVGNNDELIFLDPDTDGYTNDDGVAMLDENQSKCDNVIGNANYDIGHVFSTDGGGVASLGSVCISSRKAKGVTGSSNPIGDYFYFDFVAHEMGHQFGANHSFNGDDGSCAGDNRNDATAVEPGSGSTLMAYAGLCSSQNVQSRTDLYFHAISIDEIWTNITSGSGSCGTESNLILNNNAPIADAGADFLIPIGTPFVLEGFGSDADGDPISFGWEQVDNEITSVPPSPNATQGALYRSVGPTADPNRYLPNLMTISGGATSSKWEVTPNVSREINFRLTVRDNHPEAGQTDSDDLKVTVTDQAGPFLVTSQDEDNLVWSPNTSETITWDVAGTDGNGIDVTEVHIFLSTDGGLTFDTLLAGGVPNDGSQNIVVPSSKAPHCFVMIKASGNHFFAVNQQSFSIGYFNEICNQEEVAGAPLALPIPDNDPNGVSSTITIDDNVIVENLTVKLIDESGATSIPGLKHTYLGDLVITLESPTGTVVELMAKACEANDDIEAVFTDEGQDLLCSSPVTGKVKPNEELSIFRGENAQGNWILNIVDTEDADTGTLESWGLEICSSEPSLGVNKYVFEDFTIYPNPSDGHITVRFRSEDAGDVHITVFDVLGRQVMRREFKNQSNRFEEQLDLSHVSGGIYILKVQRGNKVSSQKIRVK